MEEKQIYDRNAMITGITGQDGSYLAKFLLKEGYMVFGTFRRTSNDNFSRLEKLGIRNHPNLCLVEMDITDMSSIIQCLSKCKPKEFYNLAGQSFVGLSFEQALLTFDVSGTSVLKILEAIRLTDKNIRFYQASTSELYGNALSKNSSEQAGENSEFQDENTPFQPCSPYGVAKLAAHKMVDVYRKSYGLHASCGILFNHESPLRGNEFVTRKITRGIARIKSKKQEYIELGNLESKRDWGFAGDYVKAMHLMLQQDKPNDYVVSTGETQSVRFFVNEAFYQAGIDIEWKGQNENEVAIDKSNGKIVVKINEKFYRPNEVPYLRGNSKKIQDLGWRVETKVKDLIKIMVESDLQNEEKN